MRVILKPDRQFLGMSLVRGPGMVSAGTAERDMILYQHAVVDHRHRRGTLQPA